MTRLTTTILHPHVPLQMERYMLHCSYQAGKYHRCSQFTRQTQGDTRPVAELAPGETLGGIYHQCAMTNHARAVTMLHALLYLGGDEQALLADQRDAYTAGYEGTDDAELYYRAPTLASGLDYAVTTAPTRDHLAFLTRARAAREQELRERATTDAAPSGASDAASESAGTPRPASLRERLARAGGGRAAVGVDEPGRSLRAVAGPSTQLAEREALPYPVTPTP